MSTTSATIAAQGQSGLQKGRFNLLSNNPGKRAAEKFYFFFFLASLPFQIWTTTKLSYSQPNDLLLVTQGLILGIGVWGGATFFRAAEDRTKPFYEVYGFKLGCFLFVWAVIGGYLGTDPWYEVLHGHFAFNTELNPNGVPLFMLPMTIAVFGAYATILGALFRIMWWMYQKAGLTVVPSWVAKLIIFIPLAALMPLLETLGYTSPNYCFDNHVGQWFLNVFVYGSWHLAALPFYTSLDEQPGANQKCSSFVIKGFATVGILMLLMQLITEYMAPNFTEVHRGARNINDWGADNCLGPKPNQP